jgi:hypothetical protein
VLDYIFLLYLVPEKFSSVPYHVRTRFWILQASIFCYANTKLRSTAPYMCSYIYIYTYIHTHTHNGIQRALPTLSQYLHVSKETRTNKVCGQTMWVNIQNTSHGYKHYVCISSNSEFYTTEDVAVTFCSKECRQKWRGYGKCYEPSTTKGHIQQRCWRKRAETYLHVASKSYVVARHTISLQ